MPPVETTTDKTANESYGGAPDAIDEEDEDELAAESFEEELKKAREANRADAATVSFSEMGGGFLTFSFIVALIGSGLGAFAVWSLQGLQSELESTRLLVTTQARRLDATAPLPDDLSTLQRRMEQLSARVASMQAQVTRLEAHPPVAGPQLQSTPVSGLETTSTPSPEITQPSHQEGSPVAEKERPASSPSWVVNVAVFSHESRARLEMERLLAKGFETELKVLNRHGKKALYRLRSKGFASRRIARDYAAKLRKYGVQPQIVKKPPNQ